MKLKEHTKNPVGKNQEGKEKKKTKKPPQNYIHSMIELNSFQEPSFEVNSKIYNSKYVR